MQAVAAFKVNTFFTGSCSFVHRDASHSSPINSMSRKYGPGPEVFVDVSSFQQEIVPDFVLYLSFLFPDVKLKF